MLRRWTARAMLVLALALPLACGSTPKTADTGTPQPVRSLDSSTPTTADTGVPRPGRSLDVNVSTGGNTRDALLHIPATYAAAAAVPLVIDLHGDGSNGREQEALSGMSALSDREGFLVAYPNALNQKWDDAAGSAGAADRRFISALITTLQSTYRVDPKRIYATGMSNGGGMTNRLGCDMAGTIAAIAPVEGGYVGWDDCDPSRPMPVMAFHGLTDQVVPYGGGEGKGPASGIAFPSIPDWAAAWASRDSCSAAPQVSHPNADVTRREWTQCAGGASVILYAIDKQGHSWPGSKLRPTMTSQAIDASSEMWSFFQAHPKP